MYHAHNMLWLLPVAVACWLGAVVVSVLSKRPGSNIPRWLPITFALGFIGCIVVMTVMRGYDDAQKRAELRGIDPAGISVLHLGREGVGVKIPDPPSILAVMSELKAVQNIGAHHTHPNAFVDVDFEYQQRPYHYHIGRDSGVPQEYWIEAGGGRINSATFGPLIDKLVAQPTAPKASP
jgi:hypothetical protein